MSDKVFTKKMTMSICLILLCLCALSISAGAFFSDTSSLNKTYSTATYDLTITATKQVTTLADSTANPPVTETVVPDASVSPDPSEPHKYTLTVLPDTRAEGEGSLSDKEVGYSVRIAIDAEATTATTSGYCKILIQDASNPNSIVNLGCYYTGQIAKGTYEASSVIQDKRNIKILTDKEVLVTFIPLWGTYSGNPLNDGDTISIDSAGASSIIPVTTDSGAGSSTDTSGD